jgi:cyclophilin family peptidyl-prolyl cis-trans isomerase
MYPKSKGKGGEQSKDGIDRIHELDLMGLPYVPPSKENHGMGLRTTNPVVFLEVATMGGRELRDGTKTKPAVLGKVFLELRRDLVPVACSNFITLIRGTVGVGDDGVRYHYKGTKIHRIVKDTLLQAGDLLDQDGECSRSIYNRGGVFRDENFLLRHTGPGCLSYCNRGPDSNGSLFQITLRENPDLDNRFVVFGCVVNQESLDTLYQIGNLGTAAGKPIEEVRIIDCGVEFEGDL